MFCGHSQSSWEYLFKGKRWQGRAFRHKYKGMENHPSVKKVRGSSKLRYLMPLDQIMHKKVLKLSKPYPKRAGSKAVVASVNHTEEGGSTPTPALQIQVKNG